MKLETIIGLVLVLLLGVLSVVEIQALYLLGLFAIGWQIPDISRALASIFRKNNGVA